MKKDNQILGVFVALFISIAAAAQSNRIDSLQRLVNNSKEDTLKVNHLLLLSKACISSAPDDAIKYSLEARDLSRKLDFKPGIGYALKNIGMVYYNQTKYVETIEYWNQSHAIFDSIQDHVNVSLLLSNLGSVYMNQGDDAKALEYYLQSLQIAEKINDKQKIAIAMGNIGTIYSNNRSTYETALEYYLKALPLSEELEDKNVMGGLLVNIGETYLNKDKNDSALFYLKRSLKAYENTENIPYSLNDIGKTYTKKGNYDVAERYHQQALAFAKKFELQLDITQSYLGLGTAYSKQKKYTSALNAYNLAKSMAGSINLKKELRDAYQGMATTYASMKDFGNAFHYQTLYTDLKDTLINIDIAQKITNLQTNFDIQKKQGQIDLLTKDKALQELDIRRQKLAKNAFLAGFGMILIIAFILYRNYRGKVKVNKILDQQNAEIQRLILNILPAEVADELQKTGHATPRYYESVSVLFTDFVGFTKIADTLSPQEVVAELNDCFFAFDRIMESYNLEKIKTIGDSYMCAGGIPRKDGKDELHAIKIVRAAMEIRQYMEEKNKTRKAAGAAPWELRIGIHTGPVVAGVVGKNKYAYDIWGSSVNIASRMESNGVPGEINISETAYELVREHFDCTHRGKIFAKNVGEIDMYFVKEKQATFIEDQEEYNLINLNDEQYLNKNSS